MEQALKLEARARWLEATDFGALVTTGLRTTAPPENHTYRSSASVPAFFFLISPSFYSSDCLYMWMNYNGELPPKVRRNDESEFRQPWEWT
jgi:hypothetical protein